MKPEEPTTLANGWILKMEKVAELDATVVGYWLGNDVAQHEAEGWAEALWRETYGDLASVKDGVDYVLHVDEGLDPYVCLCDHTRQVASDGRITCAPILTAKIDVSDVDQDDPEDVAGWEVCNEENYKADCLARWVEEIIQNLEPLPEEDEDRE